jgi:hypothetical protein
MRSKDKDRCAKGKINNKITKRQKLGCSILRLNTPPHRQPPSCIFEDEKQQI